MVTRFVACIALIGLTFAASVICMIKGWGLAPRSWGWIIAMWVSTAAIGQIMRRVMKEDKD